ncbi:MAG TPA: type II toxin-antitoxin system prevent-host-death family antitoxin [Phenylobacterium sp.]|nr:type II toxin-antitoxin system prevent-host-death family antitoxin [Phenylobacterium sp.]
MSQHSVAEAKNQLSGLIERALEGEKVTITKHGRPVVSLTPEQRVGRATTEAEIAWMRDRARRRACAPVDSVTLVEEMREEDFERLLGR